MGDDFELPPLPRTDMPANSRPLLSTTGRKRSQRSYELPEDDAASITHTSSDPALFSSDETPDLENYTGVKRRKKKTYAGTWWGDRIRRASSGNSSLVEQSKRKFKRNYDSGIFMPSDDGSTDLSSDSSFAHDLLEEQRLEEQKSAGLFPKPIDTRSITVSGISREHKISSPVSSQQVQVPKNVQHAQQVIARCIEENKEHVDLSDLQLVDVPTDVKDLNNMIRENDSFDLHFSVMSAKPRLFLSNNLLRRVPLPILSLTNLRELSLRRNKLTHLPSGMRALINLKTLNIAGNKLQHLPREVLDLIHNHELREITAYPNPWLVRTQNSHETTTVGQLRDLKATLNSVAPSVPRLTEFVLRQLSKHNTSHQDLRQIMPSDTPAEAMQMLERLHETQLADGSQCTNCERSVVVPARREVIWSDAWELTTGEKDAAPVVTNRLLPFEHLFCGQCRNIASPGTE